MDGKPTFVQAMVEFARQQHIARTNDDQDHWRHIVSGVGATL